VKSEGLLTALDFAIEARMTDVALRILERPDFTSANTVGPLFFTPLMRAIELDEPAVADAILQRKDFKMVNYANGRMAGRNAWQMASIKARSNSFFIMLGSRTLPSYTIV